MIEGLGRFKPRMGALFGIAVLVVGAVTVDLYALDRGFSYRELIVAVAALIGGVVAFGGERGIRFGFVLWALTLALGYRAIHYTKDLPIHPAELLLWLLFFCVLAQREFLANTRITLPLWIWLLVPFCVLGWWPLVVGDAPWDKMLNEFRSFLLLLPLMIVGPVVLQQKHFWRYLLVAFFLASTWIALMGVIEYWFPQVTEIFPLFINQAKAGSTAEGFVRATFSFYGGASATFVCVLALPVALVLAAWWSNLLPRLGIIAAAVLQILAIYIGGYRSIWLVLLIQVLAVCVLRLRKHGVAVAVLCLMVALGGYHFIPNTNERVLSGVAALQGAPIDNSAYKRKVRALDAIGDLIESPFGSGWSSAGWVHSDFLQIAANLGIIGGLIFLGGYLYTLGHFWRRLRPLMSGQHGDLGFSLLLSFIAVGGLLAMEAVSVLPQLILPVWFIWMLVEVWLRQTADQAAANETVATVYANPLRQLDYRGWETNA